MKITNALDGLLAKFQNQAFRVGAISLVVSLAGLFLNRQAFMQSYLLAFLFWVGIALGSLAILMLHQLSGGAWGEEIEGFLRIAGKTIPLLALFFIPVILGV